MTSRTHHRCRHYPRCAARCIPQTTCMHSPPTHSPLRSSPRSLSSPGSGTASFRCCSNSFPCSTGNPAAHSAPHTSSATCTPGTHPANPCNSSSATGTRTSHYTPPDHAAASSSRSASCSTPPACWLQSQCYATRPGACTHRSTGYGQRVPAPFRSSTWIRSSHQSRSTRTNHSWSRPSCTS
jgi:hypothetical protein